MYLAFVLFNTNWKITYQLYSIYNMSPKSIKCDTLVGPWLRSNRTF